MSAQKATQYALIGVGTLVVVIGLAMGLIPINSNGAGCGSLFHQANPYMPGFSIADVDACDAAYATRKGIVWTLVIIGGVVAGLAALKMLGDHEKQSRQAAEEAA